MEMKDKLWCDLRSTEEKIEFLRSGRAVDTGIMSASIAKDILRAYERIAELEAPGQNAVGAVFVTEHWSLKKAAGLYFPGHWECEKCRYMVIHGDHYCENCGRKLDWEERDNT